MSHPMDYEQQYVQLHGSDEDVDEKQQDAAPPADVGRGPWLFLLGCYTLEGSIWGLALTWGVFQNYYSKTAPFSSSASSLPIAGTACAALSHFGFPVISPLIQQRQHLWVPCVWAGWALCLLALVLASFATSVTHLILTQGVLYGIGWAVCYTPFLLMLNQWFVRKRGMAYGILFGSSGLFAMVLPFTLEAALAEFGAPWTLRWAAMGMALVSAPLMLLIRPRVKPQRGRREERGGQYKVVSRSPLFWILSAGVLAQSTAWFLPRFFLPSFAADLGLEREDGAILLACFGLAQVAGQTGLGWASDKVDVYVPLVASTGVSAVTTLGLWAPARQLAGEHVMIPLMTYSVLYGGFGGGFGPLWSNLTRLVTGDEEGMMAVYATFMIMRGTGNVLSGPVSAVLLGKEVILPEYGLGKYKGIAIFVGAGMLLAASTSLSFFAKGLTKEKLEQQDAAEMEPFVATPTTSEHDG